MVSDSEPRYRLVDSQGNTVGTLYAKSGGTLALQEGSSGSDNEIELQTDGTLQADSINTGKLDIGSHTYFTEDGNSPTSFTLAEDASETFTLSGEYDVIFLDITFENTGRTPGFPGIQLNGETGQNYTQVLADGTTESESDVDIGFVESGNTANAILAIDGRFSGTANITLIKNAYASTPSKFVDFGFVSSITSPITQISIVSSGESGQFDLRVIGRDYE